MRRMIVVAALLPLVSACASIVSGQNQSLSVETRDDKGNLVANVNCKLINDKGTWFVTTAGSVGVQRSYDDLQVQCARDGLEPGGVTVKSSTKGMAFGNVAFGLIVGPIGAIVDAGTGAAYDYPPLITVIMGQTTQITSAAEPSVQPQQR